MSEILKDGNGFIGYEYKEVLADSEKASMFLDGYTNFGWTPDENIQTSRVLGRVMIKLKRDRKIINRAELTRLQRHFEACMNEIDGLEASKTQPATIWALAAGIVGTAFLAGSVFAVTAAPPMIALCIILGVPGLVGWALPYFIFKKMVRNRAKKVAPLIEQKYDEIYEICEKGSKLL